MTNFPKFIYGLAFAFGLPWLLLIIIPTLRGEKLEPIAYEKERDEMEGEYPGAGIYRQGQLVYLQEGCTQCHTQLIRPSFEGLTDGWKKGWGQDQADIPRTATRPSTMRDYLGEPVAPLGYQRNGPDLANLGYRLPEDDGAIHLHLYAPRETHEWSVMPSFRHLYKVQPIQGAGSPHALNLPDHLSPGEGLEVVPTSNAQELVKYLRSLKKDAPIPGDVPKEEAK